MPALLASLTALLLLACQGTAPEAEHENRRLVEARNEQADLLDALGYVEGTVDPLAEQRGVLQHDPARSSPGLNLYYSRTQEQAELQELDGTTVFRWAHDTIAPWQHVELDPATGGLLVLMKDAGMVALDQDSTPRWQVDGRLHHDLSVDRQGRIHVLARRTRSIPELHPTLGILEDMVQVYSPEGALLEEWSLLEALRASPFAFLLADLGEIKARKKDQKDLDLFHANHIAVFDGALAARSPLYAEGNVLVSLRNLHTVLILDGRSHEVLWLWGPGNLSFQHDPELLDNGHLLIFDNGRKRSRVLELDPLRLQVTWRYDGPPSFFSATRGSVQRLANGNTLITISDSGYVREVDPDGKIAWELANPDVDEAGVRGAIWRMKRFPRESLQFLD